MMLSNADMKPHVICHMMVSLVDELSLLVAPAIDGAVGVTGVCEVPEAAGLAGKVRLRFVGIEALAHGVVHLRYAVEPN
jgi:riboflavin biosynthesis pyrimidine reductase